MNQSNDNIRHTRLGRHGSRKTQDMSVTIDVNDVFEEVVKQNERLVKEIEFYEEVVNDLVTNVKTCIVCQQNDVIKDRISELETQLKSKTIDNSTDVKSDDKDCDKNVKKNMKSKSLQKLKKTNKRCVKEVTDSDSYKSYKTSIKTLKKTKKNLKIEFKSNNKTILKAVDEVTDDNDSNGQTVKSMKHIKLFSDEYDKRRKQLKNDTLTNDGSYQCKRCDYKSNRFEDFESHVNRYHLNIKPYKCHICGQNVFSYDSLRKHKNIKHFYVGQGLDQLSDRRKSKIAETLSKFQCKYCQKYIQNKSVLKQHVLRVHHNVKPSKLIECDMCDKSYSNSKSLFVHKRLHHGIGSSVPYYYCDWEDCLFKSPNKSLVTVHKKSKHLRIRDYVCDWPGCDYRTTTKNSLSRHQIVHSDKYDYRCQWPGCEFRSKQEYLLKKHMVRMHEDIPRTHACHWPGCDKTFKFTAHLTNHMKLHNDPHLPCPQCKKLFKTKKYLDIHRHSHTGWLRVDCPVKGCNKLISNKTNVRHHLRVHHKDWTGN
ncbi:zinc finger protein 558-like [Oppia nitens]|uniref:zinc finger protein 558-like n=1 Tax=Oppia nitens TaxID=1686743 RepID=UPI0023DB8D01|nr:zinc finger protein 558-like [Oppia nitens]